MADPEIVVRGRGDFSRLNADLAQVEGRSSRLGSALRAGLAAGAIGGAYALGRLGKASVDLASDSQQSLGATRSVFGKYANDVLQLSRKADTALGLSANAYRELSNQIGASLRNTGIDDYAGQTERLVRRGADLAATFGGTTAEAVQALGAALRGEYDPLERYGVTLNETRINSVLTRKGMDDLTGSALTQAKQQARLAAIFEDSGRAAGQFRREADTLAGQEARLEAQTDNLQSKLGRALIPVLTDLARFGNREVIPFLTRMLAEAKAGEGPLGELGDAVEIIADALSGASPELNNAASELPSLTDAAKVGASAIGFLADNADKLDDVMPFLAAGVVAYKAAQLGANAALTVSPALKIADIAATRNLAVATRELAAAQATQRGSTAAAGTAVGQATSQLSKMQVAARGAAGIGGLGALAAGATTSDDAVGTLLSTLGGAATGFAFGGPLGAAVGGLGGLLGGLASRTDRSTEATKVSASSWRDYAGALDQASGAITQLTRDETYNTLQKAKAFKEAEQFGISRRTLLNAVLGQASAQDRLNAALQGERDEVAALRDRLKEVAPGGSTGRGGGSATTQAQLEALADEIEKRQAILDLLDEQVGKGAKSRIEIAKQIQATRGIPTEVTTRVQQDGVPKTLSDFRELIRGIELTPKKVRTLVETTDIDLSRKQIRSLIDNLEEVEKVRPNMRDFSNALRLGVGEGTRAAGRDVDGLSRQLREMVTGRYDARVTADVGQAVEGIGRVMLGLDRMPPSKTVTLTTRIITKYVTFGINPEPGRGGGPNRVLDPSGLKRDGGDAGERLGDALLRGLDDTLAKKGGKKKGLAALLAGLTSGDDVDRALDQLQKALDKRYGDKKLKAVLKSLRNESAELREQGRLLDKNATKLGNAQRRYAELVKQSRDYSRSLRDALVATGDVTNLGQLEDGSVSLQNLLDQERDRVAAAKRYSDLIQELQKDGLNRTTLDQLLAKGAEGGLATAEAIASGGAEAVKELNKLTKELVGTGTELGDEMSDEFYGAGIKAAQGVVRGLLAQRKRLRRAMAGLVDDLLDEVNGKRRGGGDGGGNRLLRLDVDETHARAQGRRLAAVMGAGMADVRLADAAGSSRSSAKPQVLEIKFTAEQLSRMQRGREVNATLNIARSAGARTLAIGGSRR